MASIDASVSQWGDKRSHMGSNFHRLTLELAHGDAKRRKLETG